jgi:hypothetical protein
MSAKPTRHTRPKMTPRAQEAWDTEKRLRGACEQIIAELKSSYGFDVHLVLSPFPTAEGAGVYHLYEKGFRPVSPTVSITGAKLILDGFLAVARAVVRGDER